jgi:hypothetical protein
MNSRQVNQKIMNHYASSVFWAAYESLPYSVQSSKSKLYNSKRNPKVSLKKIKQYWVGIYYKALAMKFRVVYFGFGLEVILSVIGLIS